LVLPSFPLPTQQLPLDGSVQCSHQRPCTFRWGEGLAGGLGNSQSNERVYLPWEDDCSRKEALSTCLAAYRAKQKKAAQTALVGQRNPEGPLLPVHREGKEEDR
jgi:hypothetical protein